MKEILKPVSRSFYLTIRFLPRPLREPVSLAYLLARATDTVADTAAIAVKTRLTTLGEMARVIAGELDFAAIKNALMDFAAQQSDPHERTLIENLEGCFDRLATLDPPDQSDIRELLKTILRGQQLDLERFGDPTQVNSLRSAEELDEYIYLVAGCVGEFWTRLGFRKLTPFATRSPNEMTKLGIEYGKGLQLINVLRDRSQDLANGRDYLPAEETSAASVEAVFDRWLEKAQRGIESGIDYACCPTNWRMRFATALPALIGKRTIALLRAADPDVARVKVSRKEVRRILLAGALASFSPIALRTLFDRM